MNRLALEEYTLGTRLGKLESAVEEIRRLRYLIRRYKNAQGDPQMAVFPIGALLDEMAANAREQLPELAVMVDCDRELLVDADQGLVRAALTEVVSNACRECRVRPVGKPRITLTADRRHSRALIAVEDNALPAGEALLADPFAEDASTYRAQGKGSGLGLAIVKETFIRHGSRCRLTANTTAERARRSGVTFAADLALAPEKHEDV